ncbi:MAG: hypothetical protein ACK5MQ_01550, partial [Pikeienuella sp.]
VGDPFAAARAEAAAAPSLPVGGGATIRLSAPPPEGVVVRGPDGVTAAIGKDDEGAFVALQASADASPGEATLRVYAPDDPFRPREVIAIRLLPGAAPRPTAPSGALSPGGRVSGALALGAEARIPVEVTEAGAIEFASHTETDLAARLLDKDGKTIAGDDDGGAGYGFSIEARLEPGRYFLSLSHCCGGGGGYEVSAARR